MHGGSLQRGTCMIVGSYHIKDKDMVVLWARVEAAIMQSMHASLPDCTIVQPAVGWLYIP